MKTNGHLIAGIILTPIFGFIAFIFTAGGHGTYLIALALFPWGMLIGVLTNYLTPFALVVGASPTFPT